MRAGAIKFALSFLFVVLIVFHPGFESGRRGSRFREKTETLILPFETPRNLKKNRCCDAQTVHLELRDDAFWVGKKKLRCFQVLEDNRQAAQVYFLRWIPEETTAYYLDARELCKIFSKNPIILLAKSEHLITIHLRREDKNERE